MAQACQKQLVSGRTQILGVSAGQVIDAVKAVNGITMDKTKIRMVWYFNGP